MSIAAVSGAAAPGAIDLRFRGRCVHPPGAVDLSRYPGLTYAPTQWGEGVRVASNGAAVADIADEMRGSAKIGLLDSYAAARGISFDEYLDALRFARSQGLV